MKGETKLFKKIVGTLKDLREMQPNILEAYRCEYGVYVKGIKSIRLGVHEESKLFFLAFDNNLRQMARKLSEKPRYIYKYG